MGTDFTDMPLKKNLTPAQMISNEISSGYASFAPLIGFLDLQRLNRCHCVWVEAFWANVIFSLSEWIIKLDNCRLNAWLIYQLLKIFIDTELDKILQVS